MKREAKRVLVIDDDDLVRELLCSTLQDAGFHTFDLPSPIGATRLIVDQRVDAVVVDIMMPAMRGDRLAKLLRGNPRFDGLGVVLVSGDASVELDGLAKEVGADSIVDKRSVREELVTAVRSAIRRHGSR